VEGSTLHTPLQSIQENNIRVFEALANTLISQRFHEVFKRVHQYFSYLFKDKYLSPFFSCLILIIQTHKQIVKSHLALVVLKC